MKSSEITSLVARSCRQRQHKFVLPNFYIGGYEMDVMSITQSKKVWEHEIKVSRSDYFADFRKGKHELMINRKWLVNRFYFVMPEGLVAKHEIPDYAGLIYVRNGRLLNIKTAPIINDAYLWPRFLEQIATRCYWRYLDLAFKYNNCKQNLLNSSGNQ